MITLKSKLVATLAVFLIASIVLSSYIALTAAAPKDDHGKSNQAKKIYSSFELTATGTATYKDSEGNDVDVEVVLSLEGKANGKMKTVFHIRTQLGEATIKDTITDDEIPTVYATKGQGIIVNKCGFIHLNIMMSEQYYGGRSTVWILRGTTEGIVDETTGKLVDDRLSITSLESRRVVLPIEGHLQLKNLQLLEGTVGTITFK